MTNDSVSKAIAIIRKDFSEQGRVHETRMGYVVDLMIWCEEKLDEMMAKKGVATIKTVTLPQELSATSPTVISK